MSACRGGLPALVALLLLTGGAQGEAAEALETALASVVSVLPDWPPEVRRQEEPEGSGVVILDGRTVATALHVVNKARSVRVRSADGQVMEARLAASDPATDIAILALAEPLPPIAMSAAEPALGTPVCAIGNAFGLGLSVSCGVVSAVNRAGIGFNPIEDFVQTDAAVNPGASGGALVTRDGRFVGLLSAIFTKRSDANIGVNFAIAAPLVEHVAKALHGGGRVARAQSGLRLAPALEKGATGTPGARVISLAPGSPAEHAGLAAGDVIVMAGARPVRAPADFTSALSRLTPPGSIDVVAIGSAGRRTVTLRF